MSTDTALDFLQVNSLDQQNTINLLKIKLTNGTYIFICDTFDFKNYLGDDYKLLDFAIAGDLETQTEEKSRPTIELANPNSMFNKLALSGQLEGALVTRYQLEAVFEDEANAKMVRTNVWKIYQIPMISTRVTLQLRRLGDSPNQKFPPRAYYPPDFGNINA